MKKQKNKLSSYSFWITLFGIIFLIAQQSLKYFGIDMDNKLFLDISSGICIVLIGLGVITGSSNKSIKDIKKDILDETESIQDDEDNNN